jgi:Cys-tRNA(Pro)/Cys-tRNA(Cys) deacylase
MMRTLEDILQRLELKYAFIDHDAPIRTAQEGAAMLGIEVGQTAPTLVLKTENGYYACILSGSRGRIQLDAVAKILGCNMLKMASAQEVEQVTGYGIGRVPLAGHNLPTILDRELFRYPSIYGGTGVETTTLKIKPDHLEKINKVVAYLPALR